MSISQFSQAFEYFGLIIGILSVLFAVWVYRKQQNDARLQQEQLEKLDSITRMIADDSRAIGHDTRDITRKIDADSYQRDFVNKFFCAGKAPEDKKFICLFPAILAGRRLPSIYAGDYHALHILQSLLGADNLDLSFQNADGENRYDGANRDAIYLCAPQANPALNEFAAPLEINRLNPCPASPRFANIELPCWFVNEEVQPMGGAAEAKIRKTLWVRGKSDCLRSLAEQYYENPCPQHVNSKDDPRRTDLATDLAIVLRLSCDRKIFVIAGIHQFGTWIAGEFLRRLSTEKDKSISSQERNAFMQPNDVMAILWGDFDRDALIVRNLGIHQKCLWTLNSGVWKPWEALDD